MDNFQVDTLRLYRRDFLQILKSVIWIFLNFMEVMSTHLRKVSFLILVPVMKILLKYEQPEKLMDISKLQVECGMVVVYH
jgi:hypothetical protein